jgi:prepilin-type N-terminal cleavage/methylation domain-containing protein
VKLTQHNKSAAFTIVELLIVIVIIGILVGIVIVSYNGVTDKARVSTLQNDLSQAASNLELTNANNSSFPADLASAALKASPGTTYQYSYTASTNAYCLTGTAYNTSYYLSNTLKSPTIGACAGHGLNGIAAVTNYAANPNAAGSDTATFGAAGGGNAGYTKAFTTDRPHEGTTSLKLSISSSGQAGASAHTPTITALRINTTDVLQWSLWIYSTRAGTVTTYVDAIRVSDSTYTGCVGAGGIAVPANTWTKVTGSCSPVYDMYVDEAGAYGLAVVSGDFVWFDEYMVTKASTLPNFGSGTSANWVWNGTVNASTSTGPAL